MHSLVCVYVFYQAEHLYHPLEASSQRLTAPSYHSSPNSWNIPQSLLSPSKNTQKCQTGAQVPWQANVWKSPDMAYWKVAKIKLIMDVLVRENLVFVSVRWSPSAGLSKYSMRGEGITFYLCQGSTFSFVPAEHLHPTHTQLHHTPTWCPRWGMGKPFQMK